MAFRRVAVGLGVSLMTGIGVSACGSSSASHATGATLPSVQVIVEAADQTSRAPGYRISAKVQLSTGQGEVAETMSGTVQRRGDRAALSLQTKAQGRTIDLQIRSAGQTFYLSGAPGLSKESHGRPWIRYNIAAADGLSGAQTGGDSDPTRYLAYLRAVGAQVTRVGTASVEGIQTTHYRAAIDLDHYAATVPVADRATVQRTMKTLETELGSNTLPVDVWIDAQHQVRQLQLKYSVCAAGQHVKFSLLMDISDYGRVPTVTVPSAADSYDITKALAAGVKQGQSASSAGC